MRLVRCPACENGATRRECEECRGAGRVSPEQERDFYRFERLVCLATEPYRRNRIVPLSEQPAAESEALV